MPIAATGAASRVGRVTVSLGIKDVGRSDRDTLQTRWSDEACGGPAGQRCLAGYWPAAATAMCGRWSLQGGRPRLRILPIAS